MGTMFSVGGAVLGAYLFERPADVFGWSASSEHAAAWGDGGLESAAGWGGRRAEDAWEREAAWGVGRHIMGSQVFDYWKDPFGNELEHWTDGDLFTAADPPQKQPMSALLAVQWGSPHPMFAAKLAPPPGLITFLASLQLRIKRLFGRQTKGKPA